MHYFKMLLALRPKISCPGQAGRQLFFLTEQQVIELPRLHYATNIIIIILGWMEIVRNVLTTFELDDPEIIKNRIHNS